MWPVSSTQQEDFQTKYQYRSVFTGQQAPEDKYVSAMSSLYSPNKDQMFSVCF